MLNTRSTERTLNPLTDLLPRKLVHDVVISLPDSFVNRLKEKYDKLVELSNQGRLTNRDLTNAKDFYHSESKKLGKKCENRFIELCDDLDIDDYKIGQKRFFSDVDRMIQHTLVDIQRTVTSSTSIEQVSANLAALASKTYNGDVGFVAETLSHAAHGSSLDSDVISLFEIHAAKRVA